MGWSEKYKKSINCDNPKGFSQRAHCQGRKKKMNEGKEKQDHEVSMAKTQVKKSIDNLQKVARVLAKKSDADNLPAWVQAKLTDTEHNTSAAADYMGEEKKKCGDGEYWCKTDEKCKKIPKGHHVMGNGDLMKDSEHEDGGEVSEAIRLKDGSIKTAIDAIKKTKKYKENPAPFHVFPSQIKKAETPTRPLHSNQKEAERLLKQLPQTDNPFKYYDKDGKFIGKIQKAHFEPEGEFLEEKKKSKKKGGTLHNWFGKSKSKDGKPGWVQSDGSPCANEEGETKTPKCYSSRRLAGLKKTEEGKKKIRSADARKSRKDPGQQQKSGGAAPTMVRTFTDKKDYKKHKSGDYSAEGFEMQEARDVKGKGSGKKDACYHKVKSRYSVWPSAYASGALVKCRKVGAANWGNSTRKEGFEFSNWRDDFKALEIETIDLIKAEPLKETKVGTYIDHSPGEKEIIRRANTPKVLLDLEDGQKELKKIQPKVPKNPLTLPSLTTEAKKCWKGYEKKGTQKLFGKTYNRCVKKEEFSNWREELAESGYDSTYGRGERGEPKGTQYLKVNPNKFKKDMEFWKNNLKNAPKQASDKKTTQVAHFEPEGEIIEDWQKVNKKDKTDGMSQKAVNAYRRENPGSKLKTAVTEKNPGGKRAKRRKSFCARSNGQRKMHNIDCSKTPDKAICKARKRWRC